MNFWWQRYIFGVCSPLPCYYSSHIPSGDNDILQEKLISHVLYSSLKSHRPSTCIFRQSNSPSPLWPLSMEPPQSSRQNVRDTASAMVARVLLEPFANPTLDNYTERENTSAVTPTIGGLVGITAFRMEGSRAEAASRGRQETPNRFAGMLSKISCNNANQTRIIRTGIVALILGPMEYTG